MFISTLIYEGDLRTSAKHIKSGNKIFTDAPPDNKGKGEAFSPTDLTATSLANCMLTVMGIKAKDKNINIKGTTAEVKKIMDNAPRKISEIHIHIKFPEGNIPEKNKKVLEIAAKTCPVALSLHDSIKQVVKFSY